MTGKSPRKKVDALYWQGRLRVAQAYLEAAQQAHLLAEVGQDCNPVISQIVLSAIAFGDRLTAKRAQVVNQQEHAQAPRLLRDVLGNLLAAGVNAAETRSWPHAARARIPSEPAEGRPAGP